MTIELSKVVLFSVHFYLDIMLVVKKEKKPSCDNGGKPCTVLSKTYPVYGMETFDLKKSVFNCE